MINNELFEKVVINSPNTRKEFYDLYTSLTEKDVLDITETSKYYLENNMYKNEIFLFMYKCLYLVIKRRDKYEYKIEIPRKMFMGCKGLVHKLLKEYLDIRNQISIFDHLGSPIRLKNILKNNQIYEAIFGDENNPDLFIILKIDNLYVYRLDTKNKLFFTLSLENYFSSDKFENKNEIMELFKKLFDFGIRFDELKDTLAIDKIFFYINKNDEIDKINKFSSFTVIEILLKNNDKFIFVKESDNLLQFIEDNKNKENSYSDILKDKYKVFAEYDNDTDRIK